METSSGTKQKRRCQERGNDVPEERFLHGRHVAGQAYEYAHQREEESCHQDEKDPFHPAGTGRRGQPSVI